MAKLVRVETADGRYCQLDLDSCRYRGQRDRFYFQISIYQTKEGRFLKVKSDGDFIFYCIEVDIRHASTLLKKWGFSDPVTRRLRALQSRAESHTKSEKAGDESIPPSSPGPTEGIAADPRGAPELKVSDCEAAILGVLKDAETPMIGRTIAQLAGKTYNSHFRSMLKRLEVRGELKKMRGTKGFVLSRKNPMS